MKEDWLSHGPHLNMRTITAASADPTDPMDSSILAE